MGTVIRETRSVCPVCLRNISARLVQGKAGRIDLEKRCPEHGNFSVPVWHGKADWDTWLLGAPALPEDKGGNCPENCGICAEHEIGTCCALLEVTERCNLHCRYCFARGGEGAKEPDIEELKQAIGDIVRQCGRPLLQLSGGEPTLRDDLDELVRFAKEAGCSYVQLNTNGIRLAEEPDYAKRLVRQA